MQEPEEPKVPGYMKSTKARDAYNQDVSGSGRQYISRLPDVSGTGECHMVEVR